MNLREWARATHMRVASRPVEFHHKTFSRSDIEMILRQSINALVESLQEGSDLRLDDLGRLWVEHKEPVTFTSNLTGSGKRYKLNRRRAVRFRASAGLISYLNAPVSKPTSK